MAKYIDHLDEDEIIPGQRYVCLSFVSPEGIKNCSLRALKIRGVFNDIEKANQHAEKLRIDDPLFDVFVGEVGKWLPWDPNGEQVDDEKYQEKELNSLVKAYKEHMNETKKVYNDRKDDLLQKIEVENKDKKKKIIKKSNISSIKKRLEEKEKELRETKEKINKEASNNA